MKKDNRKIKDKVKKILTTETVQKCEINEKLAERKLKRRKKLRS
jgi:hypothetical protein